MVTWVIEVIVRLYENKGDADDLNNYKGIALLNCLGKLLSSEIDDRLTKFSNRHDVQEMQVGFRKGYRHSTLDHIFLLKSITDLFLWKKKKLFCLFVDYKKAFDTVWRDGL